MGGAGQTPLYTYVNSLRFHMFWSYIEPTFGNGRFQADSGRTNGTTLKDTCYVYAFVCWFVCVYCAHFLLLWSKSYWSIQS
jgi:hypothetical protein